MQSSEREGLASVTEQRLWPGVSVVIPSYNCASFLATTLDSVFSQTFPVLETIVVDDGSTDETASVLKPYLDRIVYIKQQNKGLPGARNTGLRAARGAYVALLDADDSWTPSKLMLQMPRFSDPEVGIVYSDFSVRYSDGRYQQSYLVNRPLASEGGILESYIRSRYLFPSTMVFRRACFEQVGYFDEEMLACEDIELFARICAHWKVALVNKPLMVRYEGDHNITSNSRQMSDYTILALEKVLQKERNLAASARSVIWGELGRQHSWAGHSAFVEREMGRARHHLMQALRSDPRTYRSSVGLLAASFLPTFVIKALRDLRAAKRTG